MASFQAEINRPTDGHRKKIRIRQRRRVDLRQNIEGSEGFRVAHRGQLNELLDRAAPKFYPDLLVFASRFVFGRMRRPLDAQMPQVVETGGNSAIGLIESCVQIDAQTLDGSSLNRICGAG